ncbi:hypothetical protein FQN49_006865 [Arthroderma sp. PD_2]|nr:hypothetical protein FQN49_006865 [Arthroderma sp. PD_2]
MKEDGGIDPGSRHKIIVGVDYGTTFSGVSWAESTKTRLEDINVINTWPGHRDSTWKVPSRIAYASENKNKITTDQWGFQVSPNLMCYSWTKLLLDKSAQLTGYDDPSLKDLFGSGLMSLPKGKSAQYVIEDYFRELYMYLIHQLEKKMGSGVFNVTPMEIYLTMPAIWSDQAQLATQKAAEAAGFGSRPYDSIFMIKEPEAAALSAIKPHLGPDAIDPVQPGEGILICDCGGGTVDITTYIVLKSEPKLEFEELCVGIGGKCGSTYIDRNFNQWMQDTFGEEYTSVPMRLRGPGSRFMNSFESAKRNFGGPNDDRGVEVGPIRMDIGPNVHYDDDELVVKLSKYDMQRLFDPVVKEVISLVKSQVKAAEKKKKRIDRLILVGGFGDSDYLNNKLGDWCKGKNIGSVTCPPDCQAAIVKGACLRGLEGLKPIITHNRAHYGWSWGKRFRKGIDPEVNAYTDPLTGEKMCSGRMEWVIPKGKRLDENFKMKADIQSTFKLGQPLNENITMFSCTLDEPPEREDHHRVVKVGEISPAFSTSTFNDFQTRKSTADGLTYHRFNYTIEVNFRSKGGILSFAATSEGKVIADAALGLLED